MPKEIPPGKMRNLPSEEGRRLGAEVARLCDDAELTKMTLHPRCKTCAFTAGSVPNRCEATLMDAMKCAAEGEVAFMCHERKGHTCSGYLLMKFEHPMKVPWPWSGGGGDEERNGKA